jgi:hypothetical protein
MMIGRKTARRGKAESGKAQRQQDAAADGEHDTGLETHFVGPCCPVFLCAPALRRQLTGGSTTIFGKLIGMD